MSLAAAVQTVGRASWWRDRSWTALMVMPVAIGAALLTVYDPALSGIVPQRWWALVHAEEWPFKALPVLLGCLLVLSLLVRSLPGYLALFIASLQMNGFRAGPLDTVDFVLLVGVAFMTARMIRHPDQSFRLGVTGNMALLLVLIALPHLVVQSNIVGFGLGWIGLIRSFLIAFMIINLIETRDQLRDVIRVFVAVAAISAAIGIAQFAASFFSGINVTLIDPPETAFKPTPIGMVMRSSGLCITAQHQSGFLVLALPFALWRASVSWRPVDVLTALIVGVGIIVTWNMGGILVGAAVAGSTLLIRWRSYAIQILVGVVLTLTLMYYFGVIDWIFDHVINTGVEKGISQRHTLLEIGLEKLDRNPLVGTGPHGFANFTGNFWGRPVHNTYLQIATELGIGAMLVFIAGLAVLATGLAIALGSVRDAHDHSLLLCMTVALGGFATIALSEPMMDHSNTWFFLALVQVSLSLLSRQWPKASARSDRRIAQSPRSPTLPGRSANVRASGS